MGTDYWSCEIGENRATLTALVTPEALFHPSTFGAFQA